MPNIIIFKEMSIWPKIRHYGFGPFLGVAQIFERDMGASFYLIYIGVTKQLRNLPSERMVTDLGFMTQLHKSKRTEHFQTNGNKT